MSLRFHVSARLDLLEILEYYKENAGDDIAIAFFSEFRECLRLIQARPLSFPEIRSGIRRCIFARFPHQINFEVADETTIKILVIKHQRQHPQYGMDRT